MIPPQEQLREGIPVPEEGEWRERTLTKIGDPGSWPLWPRLPMKRRIRMDADTPGGGYITVDAKGWCVTADFPSIIVCGFPGMIGIGEQLDHDGDIPGYQTIRYPTVEAMLDDGWTVD